MIILYNPSSSAQRKPVLPMSLLALGAVLEGKHEYQIIDGNLEPDPLAVLDRAVRERGAEMLAVTVMPGPQLQEAFPLCKDLKRRHPDLTIVWGGYFPTQHYDACLRSPVVDFVIRGHGELIFEQLVCSLCNGSFSSDLQGLAYRKAAGGEIVTNGLAPLPDPELLPDFPYHRLETHRYVRNTFMGRTLSHHSSYGCPFSCNFCAVVNLVQGRWKAQSAERTARVTRALVRNWKAEAVEFFDNNFFVHESRVSEFSERITDLKIHWWGEARIDTLLRFSESTWRRMADSGLKMVFLGAESGSDESLRRMNKGGQASTDKTLAIAEKMAGWGIIPEFSFMVGSPPDPEADTLQTLEFIRQVKRINPASEIILYLYTPVPLSGDLYDQARQKGLHLPESLEEWVSAEWLEFSLRRSSRLPWLDRSLRGRIGNFERVLNAYYPTSTDPRLRGFWRLVLRTASSWRYHLKLYNFPIELEILHRLIGYRRPETSGF